jgi:hypothetical protein
VKCSERRRIGETRKCRHALFDARAGRVDVRLRNEANQQNESVSQKCKTQKDEIACVACVACVNAIAVNGYKWRIMDAFDINHAHTCMYLAEAGDERDQPRVLFRAQRKVIDQQQRAQWVRVGRKRQQQLSAPKKRRKNYMMRQYLSTFFFKHSKDTRSCARGNT